MDGESLFLRGNDFFGVNETLRQNPGETLRQNADGSWTVAVPLRPSVGVRVEMWVRRRLRGQRQQIDPALARVIAGHVAVGCAPTLDSAGLPIADPVGTRAALAAIGLMLARACDDKAVQETLAQRLERHIQDDGGSILRRAAS